MDGVHAFNWNRIAHENNYIFFIQKIAVYSQSIGNAFAVSGNHDDVSFSSVTVVKRLNAGETVMIRTSAESNGWMDCTFFSGTSFVKKMDIFSQK